MIENGHAARTIRQHYDNMAQLGISEEGLIELALEMHARALLPTEPMSLSRDTASPAGDAEHDAHQGEATSCRPAPCA